MKLKFNVTGMTCAACSARVEKVTRQTPGVEKAEVNLLAGTMAVEAEDASAAEKIIAAVVNAGYGASLAGERAAPQKKEEVPADHGLKEMKKRIIGSAICLIVLMYFTMGHMVGLPVPDWYHGQENALVAALLQLFLTLPPVYLNRVYYSRGLKALWHRSPNMDSLIAVGSGAADGDQVATTGEGQGAVLGEEVRGLANGTHDIVKPELVRFIRKVFDLVIGSVECWSYKVVHSCVHDKEVLCLATLDEDHA
jgi:cation transport ATPase